MPGKFHEKCFACAKYSRNGLKLEFKLLQDNTLFGIFAISGNYQGYDDGNGYAGDYN